MPHIIPGKITVLSFKEFATGTTKAGPYIPAVEVIIDIFPSILLILLKIKCKITEANCAKAKNKSKGIIFEFTFSKEKDRPIANENI